VQPFLTFETQADGVNSMYGIRGTSTVDDPWFIGGGSTGDDEGYLEIATGDNAGGTNNGGQIYVRQYNGSGIGGAPWYGGSGTAQRTLTLLDNVGNTTLPGTLQINGNIIRSSTAGAITLSGANVSIDGDLTVTGNDIKSSTSTAITLSGQDVTTARDATVTRDLTVTRDATVTRNLTVTGDLIVDALKLNTLLRTTATTATTTSISPVYMFTTLRPVIKAVIYIRRTSGGHVQVMELLARRFSSSSASYTIYGEIPTSDPAFPGGSFVDIAVEAYSTGCAILITPLSATELTYILKVDSIGIDPTP
jgi:hypothetical protein